MPILLLGAALPEEAAEALRHDLTLTVSSYAEAARIDRLAGRRRAPVHFKIDTGMGRLGHWHEEARAELARIRRLPRLDLRGICTHFAAADDNPAMTRAQWKLISPFFAENPDLLGHAANSAVVARRYGFHAGMIRAGLALYGIAPNPGRPGARVSPRAELEEPRLPPA